MKQLLNKSATLILSIEPLLLTGLIWAYWHLTATRIQWSFLLAGWIVIGLARWWRHRRLWPRTPMDYGLIAFLIIIFINIHTAPLSRGWVMYTRPLMGLLIYTAFVEWAQARTTKVQTTDDQRFAHRLKPLLWAVVVLGVIVSWFAITATQWTNKSEIFTPILNLLPRIDYNSTFLAGSGMSFNVNEIGGALAWLCPLLVGIALSTWPQRALKIVAGIGGSMMFIALILGQSRFAIAGVLIALAVLSITHLRGYRRYLMLGLVFSIAILEVLLITNALPVASTTTQTLNERDERSVVSRLEIWQAGINMMVDHPFTGIGLSMYRSAVNRSERYIVSTMQGRVIPHAHNEWVQVGADMGVPGVLLFASWYGTVGWMLWRVWRAKSKLQRTIAASIVAGLLAHFIYGMGDAITLWDRFIFIFWILLGLAGAAYISNEKLRD
ncbi:MAG: O-antigen ligase domain-containing protein [Chloroflexi bacterium]|nr:MAG: O-antigen ligase domain-containing protein [Chloroflexota bacterium]